MRTHIRTNTTISVQYERSSERGALASSHPQQLLAIRQPSAQPAAIAESAFNRSAESTTSAKSTRPVVVLQPSPIAQSTPRKSAPQPKSRSSGASERRQQPQQSDSDSDVTPRKSHSRRRGETEPGRRRAESGPDEPRRRSAKHQRPGTRRGSRSDGDRRQTPPLATSTLDSVRRRRREEERDRARASLDPDRRRDVSSRRKTGPKGDSRRRDHNEENHHSEGRRKNIHAAGKREPEYERRKEQGSRDANTIGPIRAVPTVSASTNALHSVSAMTSQPTPILLPPAPARPQQLHMGGPRTQGGRVQLLSPADARVLPRTFAAASSQWPRTATRVQPLRVEMPREDPLGDPYLAPHHPRGGRRVVHASDEPGAVPDFPLPDAIWISSGLGRSWAETAAVIRQERERREAERQEAEEETPGRAASLPRPTADSSLSLSSQASESRLASRRLRWRSLEALPTEPMGVPFIDELGGGTNGNGHRHTKMSPVQRAYSPVTNDSWAEAPGGGDGGHGHHGYSSTTTQQFQSMQRTQTAVITSSSSTTGAGRHISGSSGDWDYEDIVLLKGTTGLGFSIAGGADNPHIEDDPSIYVTKIIPGGAAANDGRLKKDDIILRVNRVELVGVNHHVSVDALKAAGNTVHLYVKRRRFVGSPLGLGPPPPVPHMQSPYQPTTPTQQAPQPTTLSYGGGSAGVGPYVNVTPNRPAAPHSVNLDFPPAYLPNAKGKPVEQITLVKGANMGLGFSIAGGIGNEHVSGDDGIFVTKIIERGAAQADGRLKVGDKILAVGSKVMDRINHEEAVEILKGTGERVVLSVVKCPHPELAMAQEPETPVYNSGYAAGGSLPRARTPTQFYEPYAPDARTPAYNPPPPPPPATMQAPPPMAGLDRNPRQLSLNKGPSGLGFNIVGGEDGEGIFISYILPGGVADVSGLLHKGDHLLQVNNVNLRGATHEDAAQALKQSGQQVGLVVAYRPEDYARFEAKIEALRDEMITQGQMPQPGPRKELYVRALFDYDPAKDSDLPSHGLGFRYGDVLHVTNASDDEWWQARRVLSDGAEDLFGIIPSKRRVERKEKVRRKTVNFFNTNGAGPPAPTGSIADRNRGSRSQLSFSRKFPFMKSKERLNEDSEFERPEDLVLSYEPVERTQVRYVRPVIVLGPLKDVVNDDLIRSAPDRFGSCVPHTSRPKRETEVNGRDYHFTSREQMEFDIQNHLFIEAGQYNNNLYGTSVASVREVANVGKHCILDVSGNAIRRLQAAELHPVAVFVKPRNQQQLVDWNYGRIGHEEAERQFSRYMTMEQEFAESFTAIVQGDTAEEVTARVKRTIQDQSGPSIWVPSRDRI